MMQKLVPIVGLSLALMLLAGCDSLGYYGQAAKGQMAILGARESVTELLQDSETAPLVREQLRKAQAILDYARAQGLPVDDSYSHYVDVQRPFVVWNVFAADSDSTELLRHCFPIAGCVGYKGYFAKEDALAYAQTLEAQGFDVYVGGVSAYSTLGWFNDPLLNTFLFRSDERLAAVLFHELAHKVLYLEGDTVFNESFATAVEQHLLNSWLVDQGRQDLFQTYAESRNREDAVIELILLTREQLARIYASSPPQSLLAQQKADALRNLKEQYKLMQASWEQGSEFSAWMAQDLNNAHLAAIGAYRSQVPGFNRLLAGSDLLQFFESVRALLKLPKAERDQQLTQAAED